MKKFCKLILVVTALLCIITACKKDDAKESKGGKVRTRIDDGKGVTPIIGRKTPPIDGNRGITTERGGAITDIQEAKKQYLDHVDEAIEYLTGLLNAPYAYIKESYRNPDFTDWYLDEYFNEDGFVTIERSILEDGTSRMVLYDKGRRSHNADWLRNHSCKDIRNGYIKVATIDNKTDCSVDYIEYYYDDNGNLGEETTYSYFFQYDADKGYQLDPLSEYSGGMTRYIFEYTIDEDGNTVCTETEESFKYELYKLYSISAEKRMTFGFDRNGNMLYNIPASMDPDSAEGHYNKETWSYDEKGNPINRSSGPIDFGYVEGWSYDTEGRLRGHSKSRFYPALEKQGESYVYDDKGFLTHSLYEEEVHGYSYLTKETDYYKEGDNSYGEFAGLPCQSCETEFRYDNEQQEFVPIGEKTYTYYNYVTYEQADDK